MDKVKQETFSNFNYEVIKSIDERCVDVKCIYTYKGKIQAHYFSYVKSGNKPSSYYISKAKADMDKLVKSKSPDSVAKKDLNGSKATFFKRHKKLIIGLTTAVLVAGVAAAATIVTLKFMQKNDGPVVTEEEIDKYLTTPSGEVSELDAGLAQKVQTQAFNNVMKGNLNGAQIKSLSSYPFYTASTHGGSSHGEIDDLYENANDFTGFYVDNKAASKKNVYGTRLDIELGKDSADIPCFNASSIDENTKVINGNTIKTITTMEQHYLAKHDSIGSQDTYSSFVKSNVNFQGLVLPESFLLQEGMSKGDAIDSLEMLEFNYVTQFVNYHSLMNVLQYYTNNNGVVYCLSTSTRSGPNIELSEDLIIPTKLKTIDIWRFRQDKEYGWVLDSYAADGRVVYGTTEVPDDVYPLEVGVYVENDEHGNKLTKPFSINKSKGLVKLSYGERKTFDTSNINYADDETIWSYREIDTVTLIMNPAILKKKKIKDITPYYRVDNPKFNGFKFYGSLDDIHAGDELILVSSPTTGGSLDDDVPIGYENIVNADPELVEKSETTVREHDDLHYIKFKKGTTFVFDITLSKDGKYSMIITEGINA